MGIFERGDKKRYEAEAAHESTQEQDHGDYPRDEPDLVAASNEYRQITRGSAPEII